MRQSPLPGRDELGAIDWLVERLPASPTNEVWAGDDAAVVSLDTSDLLVATDLIVEGIHFDRRFSTLADVGWKVFAANVSDMAAMGGRPLRAVVGVAGASKSDLESLYEGLVQAAVEYDAPIVGGDLSEGSQLMVSIAVLGSCVGHPPVLRSGAQPGHLLFVTGPLGRSAAGLRELRADPRASGERVNAHRRPLARLGEGIAAAHAGASAMIDLSDGLGLDLHRLADASGVGFQLEDLPVAAGATLDESIAGGEDYELLFSADPTVPIEQAFVAADLHPPAVIGRVVADQAQRELRGARFPPRGYAHALG